MKTRKWLLGYSLIIVLLFCAVIILGYIVDPYFHYHKPYTDRYYYSIDNQRSQNDGIVKHFDYDAMIVGSSMTVFFKTSEADELFGCSFIKTPFYGGSFKEVNECVSTALKSNAALKLVVRGLDMGYFTLDKDTMRSDLGEFPTFLYDNNPFNDIKYLLNKDVQFGFSYNMIADSRMSDSPRGITSFDDYSGPMGNEIYGKEAVLAAMESISADSAGEAAHITENEKEDIINNITQNVTTVTDKYPEVDFYIFFPPYSIAFWLEQKETNNIERQLEAEKIVVELLLEHDNIKVFSFNTKSDIITDLNNYYDSTHYGPWINSRILEWLSEGDCLISKDNYQEYLRQEREFLMNYDYSELLDAE